MPLQMHNSLYVGKRSKTSAIFLVVVACLASRQAEAFSPSHQCYSPKIGSKAHSHAHAHLARPRRANLHLGSAAVSADTEEMIVADYVNEQVNAIHPKTKSVPRSMAFYGRYVVQRIVENRKKKAIAKEKKEPKESWRTMFKQLNEQRRNLVQLAGYNSNIIVPSFSFLLLGALMVSIIPHFYSSAITCVASNEGSSIKLFQALSGLAITSTLGAIFTGMRGSLFWIAGE